MSTTVESNLDDRGFADLLDLIMNASMVRNVNASREVLISSKGASSADIVMIRREYLILKELLDDYSNFVGNGWPITSVNNWSCFCETSQDQTGLTYIRERSEFKIDKIHLTIDRSEESRVTNVRFGMDIKALKSNKLGDITGPGRVSVDQLEKNILPSLRAMDEEKIEAKAKIVAKDKASSLLSRYEGSGLWQ